MALYEDPQATWDKRFKARHYAYRDFHSATTGPVPAVYVFGTNARAISRWNWPQFGDIPPGVIPGGNRMPCYAREVKVLCTEDCWVVFTSVNPEYVRLVEMDYTGDQIAAYGVPMTVTEVPQFLPADEQITWYPTYAISVAWYQATVPGVIYIWAEGNTEGGE